MIETRLLHYFLTVAREQNITNAARVLHITQPTLSRQMAMLEEQLGKKLFLRESRPLELTEEGRLLRRRAAEILSLMEKTEAELARQDERLEGTVTIGCGELASVRLLTEIIASFRARHPNLFFDVYTANADQIRQRMEDGLTDIGLLLEPVDMERFAYIRMPIKERWAAIVPSGSPLAGRARVTAEDLSGAAIILPSRQKVLDEVANWFGDAYPKIVPAAASNLSTNAAMMVRAGVGCALTVEGALPFMDRSEVTVLPLYPELLSTSVLAWRRGQPHGRATARFLQHAQCLAGMERA